MDSKSLIINTDGGARGNPGRAAYGICIQDSNHVVLMSIGQTIGIATNNIAEYTGVLEAYSWLLANISDIKIYDNIHFLLDSQLVCNQLLGLYKVKSPELRVIYVEIKSREKKVILESGLKIDYVHIPRAENKEADKMVNMALDKLL